MYWPSISKSVRINYFLIKREGQTLGATAAAGVVAIFLNICISPRYEKATDFISNMKNMFFFKYFYFSWMSKEIFKDDDCQLKSI